MTVLEELEKREKEIKGLVSKEYIFLCLCHVVVRRLHNY